MKAPIAVWGIVATLLGGGAIATVPAAPAMAATSPPTIASVSPRAGLVAGGTRVTVSGTGFRRVTAVRFGSTAGRSIVVLSSTKLLVTTPRHAAGVVHVRVATKAGTSSAMPADRFTFQLRPITGTLRANGYSVIALSASGATAIRRTASGRFSIRPPAATVTLQLRKPDGSYGGMIVLGTANTGHRAILGVWAGARLGRIDVYPGRGYARVHVAPPSRSMNASRWARARRGKPIGAGNFGRIRSLPPAPSPLGDLDADGVHNRLDVDIDGDLILNNVDRSTSTRGVATTANGRLAASSIASPTSDFVINSMLQLSLPETMNANAASITDAAIDATLVAHQTLAFEMTSDSPELDCGGAADPNNPQGWLGGLSYCTRGGTGIIQLGPAGSPWQSFPQCCDTDGDGFGTLPNNAPNHPTPGWTFFRAAATSSQIGTGDVLIQHNTSGYITSDVTAMMPFTFATVPAIASYGDGQGNAATIQYPVPASPGLGTESDPYPVKADANGHVVLNLTFWRPQRKPIPPEPGDWTDIGKLSYAVQFQQVGGQDTSGLVTACPTSSFTETDPNLTVQSVPQLVAGAGGVGDSALDQPAIAANTLSFTLDATSCLAAHGLSWSSGQTAFLKFGAYDSGLGSTSTSAETAIVFAQQ